MEHVEREKSCAAAQPRAGRRRKSNRRERERKWTPKFEKGEKIEEEEHDENTHGRIYILSKREREIIIITLSIFCFFLLEGTRL